MGLQNFKLRAYSVSNPVYATLSPPGVYLFQARLMEGEGGLIVREGLFNFNASSYQFTTLLCTVL